MCGINVSHNTDYASYVHLHMVMWTPDDFCMYEVTMARVDANNADLLNASTKYVVYILQI